MIDEVLAVGDARFQEKMRREDQAAPRGKARRSSSSPTTTLKVSALCDGRPLWMRGGRLEAHGPPGVVIPRYPRRQPRMARPREPASEPLPTAAS